MKELAIELDCFVIDPLERGVQAVECPNCSGFAERVDTTEKEDKLLGCGRHNCCNGAFKCKRCEARIVARIDAPEME